MIRDEERREVARRLREKKAECEKRGYPWMCDDLILALGYDHDYEAGDEIFDRLADLIEPHRGSGGRTILCAHCESASWCGCEPGDEEGGCAPTASGAVTDVTRDEMVAAVQDIRAEVAAEDEKRGRCTW